MKTRAPDAPNENEENNNDLAGIEACANHLIQGIKAGNAKQVAEALKSAFEIMESEPHEEAVEPHSYEASKDE